MPAEIATDSSEDALSQICRRLRPALMAFFLRRLHSHAEAEDFTQEVFARIASGGSLQMKSPDAYLFQVAANLLKDRGRRERVRDEYSAGLRAVEGIGIEYIDPDRILTARRSLSELVACLQELPERTRTMFILYRLENMDKKTIADHYGVSVSTVEKNVGKAMAHMILCQRDKDL